MAVTAHERLELRSDEDIVKVRHAARRLAAEAGFSLVDQTKLVTAASELARNTVIYGRGGVVEFETMQDSIRHGIRITFIDEGPGIADIDLALRDGYTSRGGLGLGLGGARRLVNEFDIQSQPGKGTRVTIARWK
jgi:serine/threonine-protein kinase RsbT